MSWLLSFWSDSDPGRVGWTEMDCLLKVLDADQGTAGVANPCVADLILP